MNRTEQERALGSAVRAARAAGKLMRQNLRVAKVVKSETAHDIKLELDVRCQKLIEKQFRAAFPKVALLGEEGDSGADNAEYRWVVDPIDGTVNFTYGIPHACVSIALQRRRAADYETVVGTVFDPFTDELWTAIRGQPAYLNGKVIRVSRRAKLNEAIMSIGFGKSRTHMETTLPYFGWLVRRARKVRIMGAAALGIVYVASGRFDAYIERGVNLWDIAAGGLILECAGGKFWREYSPTKRNFRMIASNGLLHRKLPVPNLDIS